VLVVKIALGIVVAFVIIGVAQLVFAMALLGSVAKAVPTPRPFTPVPTVARVAATSARSPSPSPRPMIAVGSWSGTAALDTKPFPVADEWNIDWETTSGDTFQILLMNSQTGFPVSSITLAPGSGSSVQHGAGTYYLKINASNTPWKVSVQSVR
jgi:hypothetical protein